MFRFSDRWTANRACRVAALIFSCWLLPAQAATVPTAPLEGTSDDRIVAFADVHGGASELRALLRALTLIDDGDNWTGGRTRLVSLGDLLDRGPDSRSVMDLLMRLEKEAAEAGGAVHLVLGNHELMNLTGDLRYVSEEEYAAFAADEDPAVRTRSFAAFQNLLAAEAQTQSSPLPDEPEVDAAAQFEARFPPGFFAHRAAFTPDGLYGGWLLSKPQVLELENIAFVHGGLSTAFVAETFETYNSRAAADLRSLLRTGAELIESGQLPAWDDLVTSTPLAGTTVPAELGPLRASLQFQQHGPAWYRGTAACHPLIERPRFEATLAARQIDRVVMGHTPTSPRIIQTRFEERAILADTGMYAGYYRGRPSAVIFDRGGMRTLTLDPDGVLRERRGRPAVDLRAEDRSGRLDALTEALAGVTLAPGEKADFTLSGKRLDVTWYRENRRQRSARLAAQALDDLLGFGLVAPVVAIERNGSEGVAEVVPATALSEQARVAGNIYRPNYCLEGSDFDLLFVLDALMGQEVRTGSNVFYDRSTWLIYLTEQNRAFPRSDRLPRYLDTQRVTLPALVARRLGDLSEKSLTGALGGYLDSRQIQAILDRRDRILRKWPADR